MLHLISGESAAGALSQAVPDADVVVFPDELSSGPARPFESPEGWFESRSAFWAGLGGAEAQDRSSPATIARSLTSDRLTVWLDTSANAQLIVGWLASALAFTRRQPLIYIVQLEASRTGMLRPEQFRRAGAPTQLAPANIDEYRAAWHAWTSPRPEELIQCISDVINPFLRKSLVSLLDRYPFESGGLNRWERYFLAQIGEEPKPLARSIAQTIEASRPGPDTIGDRWMAWRVQRIAAAALCHPLCRLDPDGSSNIFRALVSRTQAGSDVLGGTSDALEINGIDDWVGGVHLSSEADRVWVRTNEGSLRRR